MKNARFHIPINLFIIFFLAVSSAGAALLVKPATMAQAAGTTLWTAYNDCVPETGETTTNITTLPCYQNGSKTLVNYTDGTSTPVTVTVTKTGSLTTDNDGNGNLPASGTDAYNTFNGIVGLKGVVEFLSNNNPITLKFSGLDTADTYTFATTAVDSDSNGWTSFTISGITSATNSSTSGATISADTYTTSFYTHNNTNGYVARWTNIVPAADGTFSVLVSRGSNTTNGPSAFMLSAIANPVIVPTGTTVPFVAPTGAGSQTQTITCSGTNLISDLVVTATSPYEVSLDGINFYPTLNLTPVDGTVPVTTIYVELNSAASGDFSGSVSCTSTGATEQDFTLSGTVVNPVLTVTGTLDEFYSYPGVASDEQTYTVAGSYLFTDLVVTAPAGYEVSLTSGSGFGPTVDITPVDMSIPTTTIYVHLLKATPGYSSSNITNVTSAVEEDQPVTGLTYWMSYMSIVQFNPTVIIQSHK